MTWSLWRIPACTLLFGARCPLALWMPLFLRGRTGSQSVLKLSEEQRHFPLGHWKLQSKSRDRWGSSATWHLPSMFQVLGFSSSSKINWLISNHRCPFVYLIPWTYLKAEHSATCLWSQILKKLAQEGCLNSVSKSQYYQILINTYWMEECDKYLNIYSNNINFIIGM